MQVKRLIADINNGHDLSQSYQQKIGSLQKNETNHFLSNSKVFYSFVENILK